MFNTLYVAYFLHISLPICEVISYNTLFQQTRKPRTREDVLKDHCSSLDSLEQILDEDPSGRYLRVLKKCSAGKCKPAVGRKTTEVFTVKHVNSQSLIPLGQCRVHISMLASCRPGMFSQAQSELSGCKCLSFPFCGTERDVVCRVRAGPGGHISVGHQKWGSVLNSSEF